MINPLIIQNLEEALGEFRLHNPIIRDFQVSPSFENALILLKQSIEALKPLDCHTLQVPQLIETHHPEHSWADEVKCPCPQCLSLRNQVG